MIAACPKCATRYRIDDQHAQPQGVRLKCSRCQAVFRVWPPAAATPEPVPAEPPPAPVETATARPPDRSASTPAEGPAVAKRASPATDRRAEIDPQKLVLVADPEAASCKATARALESWGLHAFTAADGVEAILAIQRRLPRTVVLDAALPKMFGFQVCELVKRNQSLCHIQVVLVGAIHDPECHRRSPTELYGADAYLEKPDLPDGLLPILAGFGLPVGAGATPAAQAPPAPRAVEPDVRPSRSEPASPAPAAPASTPVAPAAAPPAAPPAAPAAAEDPARAAGRAEAERLARIIVSDLVLYNEDKFMRAVVAGTVVESMDPDLDEGRALFRQRIDPRVQAERDFLRDELLRVARARGMRS